jgi:hypothetical protein
MSVIATYRSDLAVAETLTENVSLMSDKTVTHAMNTSKTLNGTSTPPATLVASGALTLSDGDGTIDLTAVIGTNGVAVDGSGLRVQSMKIRGKLGNANPITVAIGAENGYDGFGAAFGISLVATAEQLLYTADAGNNISGTNKILDVTGTGSQILEYAITFG